MLIIAAFMRATALIIAGYFVWYASSKAEDRLKTVGKYIAIWTFAFAAVLVIMGIAGAAMHPMVMGMHGGMPGRHMMGMGPGMGPNMGPNMGPMGMHRGPGFDGMGFGGGERGPRFLFRERAREEKSKADEPAPATPAPAKP